MREATPTVVTAQGGLFAAILRSIGDAVISTDVRGFVEFMNPAAEALTGWTAAEARGRPLDEIFRVVGEGTRAPLVSPFARMPPEAGQGPMALQPGLLVARDGQERSIAGSTASIRDEQGIVAGLVLLIRDRSAARAAEHARVSLLQRYESLLAALPDIIMEVDARRIYTWTNDAGREFFGNDVLGKEARDFFEGAQATYDHVGPLFDGDEQTYYVESWQRRRDGEKRLLAWWCRVLKDEAGAVVGALSIAHDVTEQRRDQARLEQSEAKYRRLIEGLGSRYAVFSRKLDGEVSYASPSIRALIGRSPEEVVGHDWRELGLDLSSIRPTEAGDDVHSPGEPPEIVEMVVARSEGTKRTIEVTQHPVFEDTRLVAIEGICHDVTEERRGAELTRLRLRLHEFAGAHSLHELLQRTLDEVERLTESHAGFLHFVEDGEQTISLQAWSTSTVAHFRRTDKEGLHYPIETAGVWADCVRQRRPVVHNDCASLPHWRGLPEGHTPLVRELIVPVLRSERVVAVLGVGNKATEYTEGDVEAVSFLADLAWDIAERKRAEDVVSQSNALLSAFVKHSPVYAFIKDVTPHESRVLVASESFQDMIGLPGSQMAGKTMPELFPPEFAAKISADDWEVVANGEVLQLDEDLGDRHYTTIKFPIAFGEKMLLAGYTIDITERKQAEMARRDLQASLAQSDRLISMGMMAAAVAHEINNPLAYMLCSAEDLAEDLPRLLEDLRGWSGASTGRTGTEAIPAGRRMEPPSPERPRLDDVLESLGSVVDGAHRIREIARGLATFSRADGAVVAPVDLNDSIETALRMAGNTIKYRARLVKDLAPVPKVLAVDGKLAQVFLNLALNAAQAIDEGDVQGNEIRVRTWRDGDWVCAEVSDTGRGVPVHLQDRLFEPFFTTKGVGVGTGLGLAICRNIMDGFGGRIGFSSEPGRPTRFWVKLPCATQHRGASLATADDTRAEPARRVSPSSTAAPRGRILVVDDEAGIRGIFLRLFGNEHDVVAVASGDEAQELLEQDRRFDVIFCDLMMPGCSGMDLHSWIVKLEPGLADRLVFMTGGAFTPSALEYLAKTENRRLEKPFERQELRRLVADLTLAARSHRGTDGTT
ncbi:MAG: PAS domain S-box protein [Polyangiaceae bacterium]|nr:PAS domain S-box protein [Polyangiaceae bacterium]